MDSNLQIRSNLMLDDEEHTPHHRYLPGDFLALVYKGKVDNRIVERELTQRQLVEYRQYLPCIRCGKRCAGTCESP